MQQQILFAFKVIPSPVDHARVAPERPPSVLEQPQVEPELPPPDLEGGVPKAPFRGAVALALGTAAEGALKKIGNTKNLT